MLDAGEPGPRRNEDSLLGNHQLGPASRVPDTHATTTHATASHASTCGDANTERNPAAQRERKPDRVTDQYPNRDALGFADPDPAAQSKRHA